jgi:hypothetical protein
MYLLLICYNLVNLLLKLLNINKYAVGKDSSVFHALPVKRMKVFYLYLAPEKFNKSEMKKIGLIICVTVLCSTSVQAQSITRPNYGLKSHETLEISKIEAGQQKTVIYLNIENRIKDGFFCADKNINIIYPDGTKAKMISSKGIPNCPETYKFKSIGEKLSFELTFPSIKRSIQTIDIVEACSDNCFSFYGVCLNNNLNKEIDDASVQAENKEPAKALISFINIANSAESKNSGIEGLLYLNIISLAKETGNDPEAAEWYNKLKTSVIPRKDAYIKHLNSQGIVY